MHNVFLLFDLQIYLKGENTVSYTIYFINIKALKKFSTFLKLKFKLIYILILFFRINHFLFLILYKIF